MTRSHHAPKVDPDLDEVDEERLLPRRLQVGAEQQGGDTGDPAVLQTVLRHVLHRLFEAEEAGPNPRPLREPDVLRDLRDAGRRGGRWKQLPLEIAGPV